MRLMLLALLLLAGCGERWDGYVYPDASNLTHHISVGAHPSLQACREAALALLAELKAVKQGDFECGLNCEDRAGLRVCKDTRRI